MIKNTFRLALLLAGVLCMVPETALQGQTLQDAITSTKNEQYDKAEAMFQQLIKSEPGNSKIYFHYGENTLLNYFSDTISNSLSATAKEAGDLFNKGVAANASDPLNYIGLAKLAFYEGNNAKAEELRVKAASLLPPYKKVTKIADPKEYSYTLAKIAESYINFETVDTSKALPFIRHALKIDPRNSEVYIIAGDIYILVNDGSKAIKNYNLAQDWNLQSPTANMKIGSIYVKGRNLMAAIPFYEQAIELDNNYAPAYRELGQLYSMAGKFSESKKYFEKYLELTKGNIPAKIRYVNALFYAKEYQEVIKNVEEIFAVDNSRTYMNRIAGYSAYEEGNYELAKSYMDKLFELLPADRIIKKDYIYYARILIRKNQNFAKLVIDTDNDASDLAKMKERYPSLKSPAKEKMKVEIDALQAKVDAGKAQILKAENELNQGFEAYDKAITFEGEDTNLIYEKGSSLYSSRRYEKAASSWARLLEKGRDSENDYLQVGRAYYQAKNFDKADEVFNKMVVKYPKSLPGYLWIANNASAKDPDSEKGLAKPKFRKVLEVAAADSVKNSKEMFDALRYLGYESLQNNDYDLAKAYYTRMLNIAPGNTDYKIKAYGSMSSMHLQMGDYKSATEDNNRILAIDPGNDGAKSTLQYIVAVQKNAIPKAHPNEISGVISDASGQPIPSASVRVKDTAAEAWTNAKGEYRFVMPEASEVLVISAKGYQTFEINVSKKRVYNATLDK